MPIEYEMCAHLGCMHFVQPNDAFKPGYGIAEYIHLDDGEKEHNHEAIPSGVTHSLEEWRALWPELFHRFPDGKVGPNSKHFEV